MSNYNNVNRVLIGDGANVGAITHLSGIQKGDLFMIDESNNIIATVAAANALPKHERITLAVGIGPGEAVLSSPIQGNTVSKYEGVAYAAPQEMVVTLGYNGTASTSISVTAETEYRLRVHIKDDQRINGQRLTLSDVNYTAGVNDDEASVAYNIACLYYQKDYGHNYMADKILLERTSDGTRAAFPVGADASVINGSKTVTFGAAHGLSIGDILKFQGATYVVAAVPSTTEVTLDLAYQGVTETILVADADTGVYTAVTEWGFKLTGIAQSSKLKRGANEPVDEYEWIIFDAAFTNADDLSSSQYSAEYELTQEIVPGQGYWKQVADAEEAAKGYLGDTSKRRFHDYRIDSNVVVDQGYDTIVITHADVHRGNFQDTYNAPLQTEIYIPDAGAQGDATPGNNEFLALLNGFFGDSAGNGVLGFPDITF
jgi:hypothetical protein